MCEARTDEKRSTGSPQTSKGRGMELVELTGMDTTQRGSLRKDCIDTAQLTVDCVMTEIPRGKLRNSRSRYDVQRYLQDRVAKIVHQIRSASSSHHFYRHVIEIDELLRCDAPLGFTPSMILAGVPDILHMLSDAVRRGYLLKSTEVRPGTARALTPVRESPAMMEKGRKRVAATTTTTTNIATDSTAYAVTIEHGDKKTRRLAANGKISAHSPAKIDEAAAAEILPFLPPLVRRPVSPRLQLPRANTVDVVPVSITSEPRRRTTARPHSQEKTTSGAAMARRRMDEKTHSSRKSGGSGTTAFVDSIPTFGTQALLTRSVTLDRQQPSLQTELELYNTATSPNSVVLRDIPSALQALLYHCALPLVCLTPEDHRHRTTAVRILASAMASMLGTTQPEVKKINNNNNDVKSNGTSESEDSRKPINDPPHGLDDILFCIRYAALASLHALMTLIDAEQLTCVNQHFASRERRRYEECDVIVSPKTSTRRKLSVEENVQLQTMDSALWENTLPMSESLPMESPLPNSHLFRLSGLHIDIPQELAPKQHVVRSALMSVYSGAVSVDALVPLMERWTVILRDCVPETALLDSARQLVRHPDAVQKTESVEEKDDEGDGVIYTMTNGKGSGDMAVKILDDFTMFTSEVRMAEASADEIYLLLRVCLHLSIYKHHARYLIAPDNSYGATYTSLPVLLCLTMARCSESDRCFSLCVECMWNLLEVAPGETVQSILQHEVVTDTIKKYPKGRSLTSLSASESLLYSFLRVLLSGSKLRQRELRNDMVVLVTMILDSDTTMRWKRETEGKSFNAEANSSLPLSTITAINTIATTVFDMVCGPELRIDGRTARMTRRPVKLLRRYHTVLSPTMRVENMQFKQLGWCFLGSFYRWQGARLLAEHNSSLSRQPTICTVSDGSTENDSNDNVLVFDVCRCGFIKVLLLYVDTECDDELVLAWTREELFTLQESAWQVLLGLMELAVPLLPERNVRDTCTYEAVTLDSGREENILVHTRMKLSLIRADILFIEAGGIQVAVRYIQKVSVDNAEPMVCLAIRVLSVLSQCPAHGCELLSATKLDGSSLPLNRERVPLLLEVTLHLIRRYLHSEKSSVALTTMATTATTTVKDGRASRTPMPCVMTSLRNKGIMSIGTDSFKSQVQQELPSRKSVLLPELTGDKVDSGRSSDVRAPFTARAFDVITHSLSLLHNIVGGDTLDILTTQQAFLSMGGVSLLLTLARYSLSLLLSSSPVFPNVNGDMNELLCAVLHCVRAFILGNEAAQHQFLEEDGVHTLLSIIMAFVNQCQTYNIQSSVECNFDDHLLLSSVLTTLADLLHESALMQESFLTWSTYDLQTPIDLEDDGCSNATQLLLRLWKEGDKRARVASTTQQEEPVLRDNTIERYNSVGPRQKEMVTPMDRENVEKEDSANYSTFPFQKTTSPLGCQDLRAYGNTETGSKSKRSSELPVFRTDRWGLEGLGLHGRDRVIAELYRRYNELERFELDVESDTATVDVATRWARRRLAVSLHSVLGLRAKVYACLAAVGFERLANVKTSPLERAKLLHIATLPSLCQDEVWGAMAEAVDLRSHAWIVPTARKMISENERGCDTDGVGVGGGENTGELASRQESVFVPILSDASHLVKVFSDVEARTTELQILTKVSVDMHIAHENETTQRFLLSRLRQGTDDTNVVSLVQQARSRYGNTITRGDERVSDLRLTSSSKADTAVVSKGPISTSSLTVIQKKRKRDAMIKGSIRQRQSGDP